MAAPPHVAVVVFPFTSHAAKLFRLARALAAASPATTFSVITTASSIAKLRNAGAPQRNLRFVEVPDVSPPKSPTGDVDVAQFVIVGLFLAAAEAGGVRDGLEAARSSAGGARVSCVVGDSFMWMAAEAAAAVEASWVPVWTGGPSALLSYLRADVLRHDFGDEAPGRADELLTSHPGLGIYRVRDLPSGIISGDPNLPFHALFRRIVHRLPRAATAVALNFFQGLIPQDVTDALTAELPHCLPVGPFHLLPDTVGDDGGAPADPHGCISWLDRHPARTVAYVSFGTIAEAWARPEELRELAAGMEATGAPILWSLTEKSWPQLPPGFLELGRVKVVPWAPQVEVLRHASVGAFVSHAGWASVLEAASSGVPLACRPFFGDQLMNARSVQAWGMGTTLHEPITREGVAASLALLGLGGDGDQGQEIFSRMQELKAMAAVAFAPGGANSNNFEKLVNIVSAPGKP